MVILRLKMAQATSPFSATSNWSLLEKMPKFEKLAKFTKLQKFGFWGFYVLQLWDLRRVFETEMNYPIVKLDEKSIKSIQKALKPVLEIIS